MAATFGKTNKMRRMESKKSYSWWWDSHVSPKNSKWLQENLEEMDQHVKRMLKLIEEDADSFAKKAEMYYQKRPELISLVEDFYRMYRSLAERYDHVTGELRKNIPSDLQSQSSGISDVGSEPPSMMPSPDRRPTRRQSGPRAAGFDFFLGGGGSGSEFKEEDESSTLDSESESDDSSINNYLGMQSNDEDQGLRRKVIELEVELREVKEKMKEQREEISQGSLKKSSDESSGVQQEEISQGSFKTSSDGSSELAARVSTYEEELRVAREKIHQSEQEIERLTVELQKYNSLRNLDNGESDAALEKIQVAEIEESLDGSDVEVSENQPKIQILEEELRVTKEKLHKTEEEVSRLRQEITSKCSAVQNVQDQLKSAQKEVSSWKSKLEKEKREVSKLQDRMSRYKTNLSDRDQEIRGLKEAISNANKSLSEENEQLKAEMTKVSKEKTYLEDNLRELDLRCQSLEDEVRRVKVGKAELEAELGARIEELKVDIDEKSRSIEELKDSVEDLQLKYDAQSIKIAELFAELSSKDDQIDRMNEHLHELHMEHMEMISKAEGMRKTTDELRSRVQELEKEVKRKQEIILEGAEEKREAIRQLCFSLEHYRNGYHRLRQAVVGHKRLPVMAS